MKIEKLLEHHGIGENPFGQEDAQTDHVFKDHCLEGTFHPAWDKIYSNPQHPATSVVFGEKGAGKTALRLQISGRIDAYNREHPDERVFVIEYDDFNPFLDCFRERLHGRRKNPKRALSHWRLWDHMDAILSLSTTRLVHAILGSEKTDSDGAANNGKADLDPKRIDRLSRLQKRDLALLAACYDHTTDMPVRQRFGRLKRQLRYSNWTANLDRAGAMLATLLIVIATAGWPGLRNTFGWWLLAAMIATWIPFGWRQFRLLYKSWRVSRQIRVIDHAANTLRKILTRIPSSEFAGQPIPSKERSDDRYELLAKLQSILKTLGYESMVVLVDRVDEPHLVNGSPERIRDLVWPMFDNKFLKHPGVAFKLLLPAEVVYYLQREEKQFYERSRLDKQNLVLSLDWTGESLYDVTNDRIRACTESDERAAVIRDLFDESIGEQELIGIFARLRVPRHLFKFLHRLLVDHCGRYTEEHPSWTVSRETLQATLAVYLRDLEAFDRGAGTG